MVYITDIRVVVSLFFPDISDLDASVYVCSSWWRSTVVFSVVEDSLSPVFLFARHSSPSVRDQTPTSRQIPQSHDGIFAARQHVLPQNRK